MGRGKTSAMINFINSAGNDKNFLFIVPYLPEVDRIMDRCQGKNFAAPRRIPAKICDVHRLIAQGKNIVATHALFQLFSDDIVELLRDKHYTLVMDEVACVITRIPLSEHDMKLIMSTKCASIKENGNVAWNVDDYEGKFGDYMQLVKTGHVFQYCNDCWLRFFPREIFLAFQDVYIMTYMFDAQIQRMYFDLIGIQYSYLYVHGSSLDTYAIADTPDVAASIDYRSKITIIDNEKLNAIGDNINALSKGWYIRNTRTPRMKELKNNIYNFFHNYAKTPSARNLWTTFGEDKNFSIEWQSQLSGGGYSKGYIACNTKGTNKYRNKTALAYVVNRYWDTCLKNSLIKAGVQVNDDAFALSEMIQWVWRSAIRDGENIIIYIPSRRMRTLFKNWLDDVAAGKLTHGCGVTCEEVHSKQIEDITHGDVSA